MLAARSAGPEWERGFTFTVIYYTFQILYKVYVYVLLKKLIFKHFYNSQALRSQTASQASPQARWPTGLPHLWCHPSAVAPGTPGDRVTWQQSSKSGRPAGGLGSRATSEPLAPRQPKRPLSPDVCSALEQLCWRTVDPGEDVPLASPRSDQSPTHRPTGCIRVITWRAWGWEWISCLWLGSPHQGCPQWGSFTHSLQWVL